MTVRAGQLRYPSQTLDTGDQLVALHLLLRDPCFDVNLIRHREPSFLFGCLAAEFVQQRGDFTYGQGVIDSDPLHNTHRHTGEFGFCRILNDRNTAALFYRAHSHRAVVARSREHDSDHARTGPACCRAEKRIDRRTVQVLFWTMDQFYVPGLDQQMLIRRSNETPTCSYGLVIYRMVHRELCITSKNRRQQTGTVCRNVQHYENSGW